MKKSFWLAVLAYIVPTFPLGYFWHLVTFHEAYERLELYRTEVIIPFGLASMVVQGIFFAWAYPRLFSTRREDWLSSALGFFGVFGALAWSFTTLPVAAKYQMTSVSETVLSHGPHRLHFYFGRAQWRDAGQYRHATSICPAYI